MARRIQDGRILWEEFIFAFGDSPDALIAELVDLVEHEPPKGGLFGASAPDHADYEANIERVICLLEAS